MRKDGMRSPRQVWKFTVPMPGPTCRSWIDAPDGAEFISAAIQGEDIVVWALVDPDAISGARRLIVANTGAPIPGFPESATFLGTVTTAGIVWHIWDGDTDA